MHTFDDRTDSFEGRTKFSGIETLIFMYTFDGGTDINVAWHEKIGLTCTQRAILT